jgi:F-type H+-transporting ATPase subunit delta
LSLQTIARRYAQALADVVTEPGEAALVQQELSAWATMIDGSSLLCEAFGNPTIAYDKKQKVLGELIARSRVRELTANFLQVLLRNQRLTELSEINKKFAHILDERAGVVAAQVTTARPIPGNTQVLLERELGALVGRKIRFTFVIDEQLIGGMIAQIGSTIYDGSVRNQLQEMRQTLVGA